MGRVCTAGLLLTLLVPLPERRILSEGMEGYILWFQSIFVKITGLGSAILIDQLFYLFLMVLQRCPPPVWSLLSRKQYGNLKIVC